MRQSFLQMAFGICFAVLLVYFLMVVNFQSWMDPFIILYGAPRRLGRQSPGLGGGRRRRGGQGGARSERRRSQDGAGRRRGCRSERRIEYRQRTAPAGAHVVRATAHG